MTPENRSYTNVSVVSASGGAARPVSFLANSNSNSLSWSPDGSFILFDSSQRTEEGLIARIDLKLRTPKFREDQFRDLFKQENPKDTRPPLPAATPTAQPSPTPSPEKKDDSKATEIVFDDIRKRASFINTGVDNGTQVISPDGKTLLILASAEGQFNIYTRSLEDLATDTSSKQITSTPGFKSQPQFSADGKDVFCLSVFLTVCLSVTRFQNNGGISCRLIQSDGFYITSDQAESPFLSSSITFAPFSLLLAQRSDAVLHWTSLPLSLWRVRF